MPKNILVFSGNFVYTMFGNYECLDYDKRGKDEDKLWGTGIKKKEGGAQKENEEDKEILGFGELENSVLEKKKKLLTNLISSNENCTLDDHCDHSFSQENVEPEIKDFLKTFAPVFKQRVKFFANLNRTYGDGSKNYKEIIKQMIEKGNKLWEKEQKTDNCGEGKCQGSWREKIKLFWYATLSVLEFINQVLDKYGDNNLPDLYFTTMAWANYIPSITEYKNIFPEEEFSGFDNENVDKKIPQEISILMDNLINNLNNPTIFTFKPGYDKTKPPLVVIDCGSSGTRIEVNRLHPIFKEECGDTIKSLVKESKKIVALHQVPQTKKKKDDTNYEEFEDDKNREVFEFKKILNKIFLEAEKENCEYKNSYGILLATAGLRDWYKSKDKTQAQAQNIKDFVDILQNKARIASCQMLDGVNEAALEHNAVKNILDESDLYCPKDNLIMFSMGGQSTQGSNGKLHFSDDKLGAIALTKSCKDQEITKDIKTIIAEKLESFDDLGYNLGNQYVFDDDSPCDKKRKFYYNPKIYNSSNNNKFLEKLTLPEVEQANSIETYLKRCDTDHDGYLSETEISDCILSKRGGSKKIRKRKRKSIKRKKQFGGKTSNKKVKKIRKIRKRRIVSKRR